jgi:putative transposase
VVKPVVKRQVVDYAREEHGLSTVRACRLIEISRSTFYYNAMLPNDAPLRKALKDVAAKRRRWGYRRLMVILQREGFFDNHKRIYRIYREERLQVPRRRRRRRAKGRVEKINVPEKPRQRWSMDFVHDGTARGQRLRMLNIVDDFARECVAIEVDISISGERVTRVLNKVIEQFGKPASLLMDNGPEFTGKALDQWAYKQKISLRFIEPGKPMQNGYIESFNGKFRDECLNEHWFFDVFDARRIIEEWREDYNKERPHSSLGYLTPEAFAATVKKDEQIKMQKLSLKPVQ